MANTRARIVSVLFFSSNPDVTFWYSVSARSSLVEAHTTDNLCTWSAKHWKLHTIEPSMQSR